METEALVTRENIRKKAMSLDINFTSVSKRTKNFKKLPKSQQKDIEHYQH